MAFKFSLGGPLQSQAGPLIGGLFSAKGQRDANRANIAMARENRAWQEKMSNTAYQRAATDMSAAGLNRILALGSPASTPGGNVATIGNVGAAGVAGAASGASTGKQALALDKELKALDASIKNQNQDTELKIKQGAKSSQDYNVAEAQEEQVRATTRIIDAQLPGARAEAQFWNDLNNGKMDSTAKGLLRFAPILKILQGK